MNRDNKRKFASLFNRISDILRNERLLMLPGCLYRAILYRLRNFFFAQLFGIKKAHFGFHARLIGTKNITLGNNFSAGHLLWLEAVVEHNTIYYNPQITIGENVSLSDCVHIAAINKITIGNGVLVGSKVLITDHNHGLYTGEKADNPMTPPNKRLLNDMGQVVVEDNVFLGDGVIVMGGVYIGRGSIIAAGTLLKKGTKVPAACIVAGNPAKIIKQFDPSIGIWSHKNLNLFDDMEQK